MSLNGKVKDKKSGQIRKFGNPAYKVYLMLDDGNLSIILFIMLSLEKVRNR